MEIFCVNVGSMNTNCYLAVDEETSKTFIIDPGEEADFISDQVLEKHLSPIGILLTHGHFDHCLASLDLKLNFSIPIYLHPKDLFLYEKAHSSAKHFSGIIVPKLSKVDHLLTDGEDILFGASRLSVIHTPGHTPGSVCFYSQPALFSGDTLFADGVGRTDLSYSSKTDIEKSINKISKLPPNTKVYPGHGDRLSLEDINKSLVLLR